MSIVVEGLVVAGGGGSGGGYVAGGGGGGGVKTGFFVISNASETITVGAGGAGKSTNARGDQGGNSSIGSVVTATGGGGGDGYNTGLGGGPGGSGGGASAAGLLTGGAGNQGEGHSGGTTAAAVVQGSGGGGGYNPGVGGTGSNAPNGGDGLASSITGSTVYYGGGGGGGDVSTHPGTGGLGGGGNGKGGAGTPTAGTANTGGGGGGAGTAGIGVAGGSGIVIIRYLTASFAQLGSGGTITTVGSYTVHTFTSSGTFTAPVAAPLAPSNFAASAASATQINLTWTDASNASYVYLYRNTSNVSGSATLVGVAAQGAQAVSSYGLSPATTYYFWLKATANGDLSAFSTGASATTSTATPAAPTALAAVGVDQRTINLTWTDAASADYVYVYLSTTNNSATAVLQEIAAQGAQALTVTGLAASTTYYFWTKSTLTGVLSAFSSVASAATTAAVLDPAAPTELAVTAQGASAVELSWTASVTAGTKTYLVYRATRNSGRRSWGEFVNVGSTQGLTYTDNAANSTPDPTEGASYLYALATQIAGVEGTLSNPVLATFQSDARTGKEVGDFVFPLQKAIYQRLVAAGVTFTDYSKDPAQAGVEVPVFDRPPEDQACPFVCAGEVSASAPNNTKQRAGYDVLYTAHVISDYHGKREASEIANLVARAISSPKLSLVSDGLNVVVSKLQGIQARELSDGLTTDYTVQFFFTIVEDPAQLP